MGDASPTAAETREGIHEAKAVVLVLKMQGQLPDGRWIVMKELTGKEEGLALTEAGDILTAQGRLRTGYAQALRSFVGFKKEKNSPLEAFDPLTKTCDTFRDMWTGVEWRLLEGLYLKLNRPSEDEAEAFEKSLCTY